ncbi:MAG: hybrid sensor histidine kinase/response regulator [Hydrogenophaga sp.]|uniref:hybrid sensor histidine kinase/response regulator n=1 Tax=Hydrogenophaga sp. TaxID=1904254 RepID=UPI003D9ADB11
MPSPADLSLDFSSLFQFLPVGAYRTSSAGVMLRANPALVRINGYDSEERMLADVNRASSDWYVRQGRRAEFRALLERDGFVRGFVSEVVRHEDGRRLWVSENAHAVRDASGTLLYYEGTVEDITAQMQAQEDLRASEERLRLLTQQIPGMVFVVHVADDGSTRYDFVSAGVQQIYGLTPDDVMNQPGILVRYRHPDDAPLFAEHIRRIHAGAPDRGFEYRIVLPDGTIRWLYRRADTVSHDATGQVRVGLLLDITDRKNAELALRESEALWKLALDGAGDGVWDWNIATGEEYVSPRILAMYGYADGDLMPRADELDALTHPDDIAQMQVDRQAHFEGRAPVYRNEHRVRCKDGRWKWVLSRGMVISRDDADRPLRMVGTHTDITELKAAEAQQRALETQLRESQKMEAIGTLAGGVAHDFNNLLAAILGNLALAREDVGPDHIAQESLAEINRAAIRARQLVQQILAFSRRQTQELQRQPLLPLVEDALRLLRSLLPAAVQLSTRLGHAPVPVLADATQVQQVLMNLCTNAWQAMDGQPGEITVALRVVQVDPAQALQLGNIDAGAYACLSVADNGPGMDEATLRRIFEPFFTTKAPGSGTGLGLSVVHGIVKAHRGVIAVHSAPGEGARFDVYLPLASDAAAADAAPPAAGPAPAPQAAGRHIVYVDDYEALVFLAARLLRKHGYRVSTFTSGEEALGWLQTHDDPVDLLVTDQNMPGMSGVELAQAVRRSRPGQRVAIVSGHVNEPLVQQAQAAGVTEVLGKQDSMDALAEAVRQLLEG